MPFTVSTVLPSDIPYLSTIQWAALLSNSLIQTLYPQGPTPELTAFTRASYQKAIQFPSVRLIKAIDEERGEIVAFAKWIVYPTKQEELDQSSENDTENEEVNPSSEWGNVEVPQKPDGVDERALRAWNIITKTRTRIMSIRKHSCQSTAGCSLECYFTSIAPALWVLDIIHTHPSHQGRGAASQLVKWGTDRADKMRMPCYVESSPAGYPLFRKFDFDDVTDMEIDLIKYRHGYGSYRYKHIVMTRVPDNPPTVPPKNSGSQHGGSGSLDRLSLSNGNSAHRISGKASLIETKRSPRPDRSSSSKESDSATSPKPDQSEASKDAPSVTSTTPNRSNFSRESETVTSMTGRFPEPPSKSEPQDEVPPIDRVWFSQALNKPFIPENEPTVDRVWFSEQH